MSTLYAKWSGKQQATPINRNDMGRFRTITHQVYMANPLANAQPAHPQEIEFAEINSFARNPWQLGTCIKEGW